MTLAYTPTIALIYAGKIAKMAELKEGNRDQIGL